MPIVSSTSGAFDYEINQYKRDEKKNFGLIRNRHKPKNGDKETTSSPPNTNDELQRDLEVIKNNQKPNSGDIQSDPEPSLRQSGSMDNMVRKNLSLLTRRFRNSNCVDLLDASVKSLPPPTFKNRNTSTTTAAKNPYYDETNAGYQLSVDSCDLFRKNQYSFNPASSDHDIDTESLDTSASSHIFNPNDSTGSLGLGLSNMTLQSQMYKMQELYAIIAKERDELQKENESLKRELSYTKYMVDGYKNAVTKIEEDMMRLLKTQQQDESDDESVKELKLQALPKEKPPQRTNILQSIKMSSMRSLNLNKINQNTSTNSLTTRNNSEVTTDDETDDSSIANTIMSLPGRFRGWNIHHQIEQDASVKDIAIDITKNDTPPPEDKVTVRRASLDFIQSRFKPLPKADRHTDVSMGEKEDQSYVSYGTMPELNVIMEDVNLDGTGDSRRSSVEEVAEKVPEEQEKQNPLRRLWRPRRNESRSVSK